MKSTLKTHIILALTGFLLMGLRTFAQSESGISGDGKYVFGCIDKVLSVRSTTTPWRILVPGVNQAAIAPNNKEFIYQKKDTLFIGYLGKESLRTQTGVLNYKTVKSGWLVYYKKDKSLVMMNTLTGQQGNVPNVLDYNFDESNETLMLKLLEANTPGTISALMAVRLSDQKQTIIWKNAGLKFGLKKYSFDESGKQVALLVQDTKGPAHQNEIWFYKDGMPEAKQLSISGTEFGDRFVIGDKILKLTKGGSHILFDLQEKEVKLTKEDTIYKDKYKSLYDKVTIRSYTDPVLINQQPPPEPRTYRAVIAIDDQKIIQLQNNTDYLPGTDVNPEVDDDYAIVIRYTGDLNFNTASFNNKNNGVSEAYLLEEFNWNNKLISNVYIVSLKDGSRKLLKKDIIPAAKAVPFFKLSPSGKYVLYFDNDQRKYFSYDIQNDKVCCLEKKMTIPNIISTEARKNGYTAIGEYNVNFYPSYVYVWLPKSDIAIIHDAYTDYWKLDLSGKSDPINLTQALGRKNNLSFNRIINYEKVNMIAQFDEEQITVLTTNATTFDQGLFVVNLAGRMMKKLTQGAFCYTPQITKVSTNKKYIYFFKRESSESAPNYYFTTDNFETIVGLFDQKNSPPRNQADVVHWRTFDGQKATGILYKPANFDAHKRYPVIITCYEDEPDRNVNIFDKLSVDGDVNSTGLKYFLDHNCLIFHPDIKYKIGNAGQSVYNYVVSGAKFLSSLPYVDGHKLGITGNSFGGYETAYLVTHSNIFAAAYAEASPTDMFLRYFGEDKNDDYKQQSDQEVGQHRLGVTPWDRPDLYLKNSGLFYADRVTTPIVLSAYERDPRVHFDQSFALFTALRRLGKKAWLISEDIFGHSGPKGPFMEEFFGHYLLGMPAAIWMTKGVSPRLNGKTLGLAYDTTMRTPGTGIYMANQKALSPEVQELLKHKTTVNKEGRIVDVKAVKKTKSTVRKNSPKYN